MCCCRAHSQCSETTVFFVVAMAGWASAVPAGSHETSQLKAFKRVLDAHVEELRHLLHEFCSQEPGSFCLLDAIESQVSVALPEKPVSLAASAARFTSHEASGAVAFARGLASQAVQQARDEEPGIPGAAMHPRAAMHLKAAAMHLRVLEPSSVATAHEHMWQARQLETKRCHIGKAIKMVREVLTLQCLTACYDSQDGEAFDNAISVALGETFWVIQCTAKLISLSRRSLDLGKSRLCFSRKLQKFGGCSNHTTWLCCGRPTQRLVPSIRGPADRRSRSRRRHRKLPLNPCRHQCKNEKQWRPQQQQRPRWARAPSGCQWLQCLSITSTARAANAKHHPAANACSALASPSSRCQEALSGQCLSGQFQT